VSIHAESTPQAETVIIAGDRIIVSGLLVEDARLAAWLTELEPTSRPAALIDIMRLGLAFRLNNQIRELNESLKHTADATLEQLGSRIQTSFVELEGKLRDAGHEIDKLLQKSVAGDHSMLKMTLSQALDAINQGLQHARQELVQTLDPRQTESIGAQLEQRIKEALRNLTDSTITPKLDAVNLAVTKLEATLVGQSRVKQEKEKGHGKGADYERELLEAIQLYAVPGTMLVRRVADIKGLNGSKDGDLVIDYDNQTLVTIECKDAKTSDLTQLESAIVGRQARVGILAHRHPNGPTAHMAQGSARIAGDNKVLLVWDPDTDDPALLTAVVGLSLLLAQRIAAAEAEANQTVDVTVDLDRAQGALDVLVEKLDLTADVVHQFELIASNAEKGKRTVDRLKKELFKQFQEIADALGLADWA
jgi:hypothetical protein